MLCIIMVIVRTRKWGNSIGIVIPKEEAEKLRIGIDQQVEIKVKPVNPLKEMYGAGNLGGAETVRKLRAEMESRYI